MGRVEFGRRCPPLQAPRLSCMASKRDEPEGTRSLLCLPYRAVAVVVVWTEVAKALRARSPRG